MNFTSCLTFFFALFLFFYPFMTAFASDEHFIYPSNWGGTGLMEIPTARVIRENSYRIGISQIHPYRYYYGAVSPVKGLEIDGRITEVIGVPALTAAYGNFKDKALDFKYRFISEGKYMPATALGIMDPHGTRVYPSQYVVISKQIYPFDFTIGFGNGRFGKRPLTSAGEGMKLEILSNTMGWLKDSQFFWGIQFALSEKYALMVEYNPIKYHKQTHDPATKKYFREPAPLNYNFGFRWKPLKWTELDVSCQRGNQIGVNFSTAFDIGIPLIPIYDHPYKENPQEKLNPFSERLQKALSYSGFSDIGVLMEGNDIWIEAQNDTYFYNTKAIGVILRILSEITSENARNVHITLKENGIPLIEFRTTKADIIDLYSEELTPNEFFYLSEVKTDISETLDIPKWNKRSFRYGVKPSFQTFLNDPSGFFKYRFGISGWVSYHPWQGTSFVAGFEGYPINTVSSANEPLSIPVRSDIVLYKRENIALGKLMFEQLKKIKHGLYGRTAAGLLDVQYAGLDGEVAMPLLNGRLMVGLSGSLVKKRATDNPFKLKENDVKDFYSTAFINMRLNIPEHEISVDLKTGRFLAGDRGSRITISKFINGVILSAWYSVTDTSVFKDNINKGYHDKGIAVTIPIRLFKGADSKTAYNYSLSPWTRDVAQDIEHYNTLFDFMGRNTKIFDLCG